MRRIRVRGWRGVPTKIELLKRDIEASDVGLPAHRRTALHILDGERVEETMMRLGTESRNYATWLRCRAREVIKYFLVLAPDRYGLERVDPGEIREGMSTVELAAFADVPKQRVLALVRGAPQNGLPRPIKKLGRTLSGQGWWFPPEAAREYVKCLIEEE